MRQHKTIRQLQRCATRLVQLNRRSTRQLFHAEGDYRVQCALERQLRIHQAIDLLRVELRQRNIGGVGKRDCTPFKKRSLPAK